MKYFQNTFRLLIRTAKKDQVVYEKTYLYEKQIKCAIISTWIQCAGYRAQI